MANVVLPAGIAGAGVPNLYPSGNVTSSASLWRASAMQTSQPPLAKPLTQLGPYALRPVNYETIGFATHSISKHAGEDYTAQEALALLAMPLNAHSRREWRNNSPCCGNRRKVPS